MIDEETRRKLRELGLSEMVEVLDVQAKDDSYMTFSFDERIRMAVDYTYEAKYTASVERLTNRAHLRYPEADMTQVMLESRGINRVQIQELGTCQFMD